MSSKDLVYKSLYETFNTAGNGSIIEELNDMNYLKRMFGSAKSNNLKTLLILLGVSLGTSLIAAAIDISAYNIGYYKKVLSFYFESPYISFLIWSSISIFFVLIGTTFGYLFTSDIDGSGIPEIKAIISGAELPHFLLWKTFFLKAVGLVCCSASLSIGREGPHIHLAAVLAHKLLKLPYFRNLSYFKAACTQIYQASVTAGVAAVLGTPIGATFFSIEITASYYVVHNLINSLAVGIICTVYLKVYHWIYLTEDFYRIEKYQEYNYIDLFFITFIGVAFGLFGVAFVKTAKFFTRMRARRALLFLHKRYRYAAFVALLYSIACFLMPTLRITAKGVFNELIEKDHLGKDWSSFWDLFSFSIVKAFFTALSISVQIPFGIFLAVLDSGAAAGRAFGVLAGLLGAQGHPNLYAAVGGAAMLGSATHALSATLIIIELTGEIRYLIPMTLAVVIACQIAKSLELNIYDVTIQSRSIPFLPAVRREVLYSHSAKDIMEPPSYLFIHCSLQDLKPLLKLKDEEKIAVIDDSRFLIAETSARRIKKYIAYMIETFSLNQPSEVKQELHIWKSFAQYEAPSTSTRLGQELEYFLESPVDFTHKHFALNADPISVSSSTNLFKIHFMFHMLGIMKIFVTENSRLVGIIKRENFTTCKK
jgi:chloride channel 2